MENPTIVVITDRNDLDGQLFGVFLLAQDLLREQPVQCATRQDLRARLANRPSGLGLKQESLPSLDADVDELAEDIGILDAAFLNEVRNLPERNLAVELLERLLEGEIKTRFASNVVQNKLFSALLANVITRYQNRSIETAQVMEELIAMAKKFKQALERGAELGLNADELAFYDALANNEASVRELGDETLKKIAHELAESLRQNVSVGWAVRENVRAKLRLMVRRILRKYKYPPVKQDEAVQLVMQQAQSLCAQWV